MEPFWKTKPLEAMTPQEWESLCDGCGKCCLAKLEDEDTGQIHWTSVACRLFDAGLCRCTDYAHRLARVHDCVRLTPENVRTLSWLPATCAYRLVADGKDLAWWHPLVSGNPETVHQAGISVRGRVAAQEDALDEPEDYLPYLLQEEP
ncbi:YcgN family cysteine cluster protein [Nitratireductor sp. GCM10026969]|uniref:YcgN family cysteine cluster protein n=1 Tax=Nitratireductor sp. GCM10026969 TaxID=3252645 RepID=UPI00361BDECC